MNRIDGAGDGRSKAELEGLLRGIEVNQKESFDLLLEVTHTGYYSHPQVLALIECANRHDSDHRLEPFDFTLLQNVRKRGQIYRQV